VVEDLSFLGAACDLADIVITPARIKLEKCYSGSVLITGRTLRRSGALEIFTEGGKICITGTVADTIRPWTRHRYYDWRSRNFQYLQ
jgi:hypothetical protein